MQEGKRQKQIGGLLFEEISHIFQRLGLNMIDGGMVSLSSVKVTPDLLEARRKKGLRVILGGIHAQACAAERHDRRPVQPRQLTEGDAPVGRQSAAPDQAPSCAGELWHSWYTWRDPSSSYTRGHGPAAFSLSRLSVTSLLMALMRPVRRRHAQARLLPRIRISRKRAKKGRRQSSLP